MTNYEGHRASRDPVIYVTGCEEFAKPRINFLKRRVFNGDLELVVRDLGDTSPHHLAELSTSMGVYFLDDLYDPESGAQTGRAANLSREVSLLAPKSKVLFFPDSTPRRYWDMVRHVKTEDPDYPTASVDDYVERLNKSFSKTAFAFLNIPSGGKFEGPLMDKMAENLRKLFRC